MNSDILWTKRPWLRDGKFVYALSSDDGNGTNVFSALMRNDNRLATDEELIANAQLISKAPDMAAQLDKLSHAMFEMGWAISQSPRFRQLYEQTRQLLEEINSRVQSDSFDQKRDHRQVSKASNVHTIPDLCDYIIEHSERIFVRHQRDGKWCTRSLAQLPAKDAIARALEFVKQGIIPTRMRTQEEIVDGKLPSGESHA